MQALGAQSPNVMHTWLQYEETKHKHEIVRSYRVCWCRELLRWIHKQATLHAKRVLTRYRSRSSDCTNSHRPVPYWRRRHHGRWFSRNFLHRCTSLHLHCWSMLPLRCESYIHRAMASTGRWRKRGSDPNEGFCFWYLRYQLETSKPWAKRRERGKRPSLLLLK